MGEVVKNIIIGSVLEKEREKDQGRFTDLWSWKLGGTQCCEWRESIQRSCKPRQEAFNSGLSFGLPRPESSDDEPGTGEALGHL